ncbi:MAG: hypothetical protein Q9196_004781 [Gyalolechia fulgens]
MPSNLSQSRDLRQTIHLPTEREASSIPRGDIDGNWEYPSPQQMYNAMLRKGYDDTPEDAVESMVAVHNFLNEGAWAEIVDWERRFSRGLGYGWRACRRGEEGFREDVEIIARSRDIAAPKLLRFQGRPNEMTPKARMLDFMGRLYPAKFGRVNSLTSTYAVVDWKQLRTTIRPSRLSTAKRKKFDTSLITIRHPPSLPANPSSTWMYGQRLMDQLLPSSG